MKSRIVLFSVLSFLFFSCATTVNVKLTRPAEVDLNGARTIAVLPIIPSDYDEQIAIEALKTQIEKGLLDSPYITLVSSEAVENAKRRGYLNPADVYLTGKMVYFDVVDKRSEEKKLVKAATDDHPAEYEIKRYWKRQVQFKLKYQIVDSSSNKVLAADEYSTSNTSSTYKSQKELPSVYSIIDYDIRKASRQILQQLQPYTVTKSITLLEVRTKDKELKQRMKAAAELADNSKLNEALKEYDAIYKERGIVEAGYNVAVLLEAMGDLSGAEEMMLSVYEKNPDNRVLKGLDDIRYEIKQAKRLNSQIKEAGNSDDVDFDDYDDFEDLDF